MISRDTTRTLVGILGNITALILFLSPVPTFIKIWKKGSVEQYSAIPYLASFINCGLWGLYGLPMVNAHSLLLITINGSGLVMELVYVVLYVTHTSDRNKRITLLLITLAQLLFLLLLGLLLLNLVHSIKLRSTIVGTICVLANILVYASPLSVMKLVIMTKSVEYMPLFLSLASFANSISWTCYALIRFDPFIAAPNGLGALFGLAQLILYATFYKSTKQQKMEKQQMGFEDRSLSGGSEKITTNGLPQSGT
ncbi:bidirectional sugar transporter SWEET4-like [Cornus florida]|uniref:bidirectional sugar transporter SWEET4-like n=1 Tax=Cornus florida TaxID=4283 RepID=UPI00289DBB5A|nr:bidirectional sugar transporter SWEET4-like [Cornus florida]